MSRPLALALVAAAAVAHGDSQPLDSLATIRPGIRTGFSNAGWKYDRYDNLDSLDAHTRMVVADLEGPGIIRHIHSVRHHPADLMARGIVLEIWFDDAPEPAVMSPLADFFGDGCDGASEYFTTPLIECAPWSYNCYFPMPFKERARVILRNDTDLDAMNYSYVEWEPLRKWRKSLGYFHASYARDRFQLTPETSHTFLDLRGNGHLLGRQFSVRTEEPFFRGFNVVMEGNNEIDIDGEERAVDYLGTEDSFTFSWGFQETFAGLRAGMPHVVHGDVNELSIYRFHDHMPIRFRHGLTWRINWREEKTFTRMPAWGDAVDRHGCMVDYATVHYWYEDDPGSYEHQALAEVGLRGNLLPLTDGDLLARLAAMPVDDRPGNTFDAEPDIARARVLNAYRNTHPFWIDEPQPIGGHPGNPNPGRQGILAVHAAGVATPAYVLLKLPIPDGDAPRLRVVVSGDPYETPGIGDFVLRAGVAVDDALQWLGERIVAAGDPPSETNWQTIDLELPDLALDQLGVVLEVAYGGATPGVNEEAFLDEISIVTGAKGQP